MNRPREIAAQLAVLPRLYGVRSENDLIADFAAGAESVHRIAETWQSTRPTLGQVEAATRSCEGLRRLLAQLVHHAGEVPDDAA
jgi:hypothetical protein